MPKSDYRETVDGVGEVAQPQLAVLVVPCVTVHGSGTRVRSTADSNWGVRRASGAVDAWAREKLTLKRWKLTSKAGVGVK